MSKTYAHKWVNGSRQVQQTRITPRWVQREQSQRGRCSECGGFLPTCQARRDTLCLTCEYAIIGGSK